LPSAEAARPKPLPPKVKRKLAQRDVPAQTIAPLALAPLAEFVPPEIATLQLTPSPALATAGEGSPRSEPMSAKIPPRFDADYLQNPAPAYPPVSRRLGEQGQVMLRVLVDSNGLPEKIEVQLASGFERLDRAAIDTVAHWRFVAARQGDTAIPGWVLIPIKFALKTAPFSDPS
jgi:protein TonB